MHDGCDINAFNILSAYCAYCFVYLFFYTSIFISKNSAVESWDLTEGITLH